MAANTTIIARSARQDDYLHTIMDYWKRFRRVPSTRELSKRMNNSSSVSAVYMIRRLVAVGALEARETPDGRTIIVPANARISNKRKPRK